VQSAQTDTGDPDRPNSAPSTIAQAAGAHSRGGAHPWVADCESTTLSERQKKEVENNLADFGDVSLENIEHVHAGRNTFAVLLHELDKAVDEIRHDRLNIDLRLKT